MNIINNKACPSVGLFTSVVFNNIGNAFIDYGAEATIKAALPEVEIIKVSSFANFAATQGRFFLLKENPLVNFVWTRVMQKHAKKMHDRAYNAVNTVDVFSPAKIVNLDYLIVPGCTLTVPFFTIYGKLLEEKVKNGCKIIFWAASGNHYTKNEVETVTEWLKVLKPYAICTRDSVAFDYYNSLSDNVLNGIDNVFFVNLLRLPKVTTSIDPYVVLNFDEPKHNSIKKKLQETLENRHIVQTNHKPFPYSKVFSLVKKNVMISENPLDYLFLYNNVKETYTDRVHACIPTLSFGNKAQLFSDSPRIALFENVKLDLNEMKNRPVQIDKDVLRNLQNKQIEFLRNILTK